MRVGRNPTAKRSVPVLALQTCPDKSRRPESKRPDDNGDPGVARVQNAAEHQGRDYQDNDLNDPGSACAHRSADCSTRVEARVTRTEEGLSDAVAQ